jgi:hypothetical protein
MREGQTKERVDKTLLAQRYEVCLFSRVLVASAFLCMGPIGQCCRPLCAGIAV